MLQSLRVRWYSAAMLTLLVCSCSFGSRGLAQEDHPSEKVLIDDVSDNKPSEPPKTDAAADPTFDDKLAIALAKKRKASAGLAAVGAIAILGVSIIAMTMVWAKRLRRLARDPLPAQRTEGNDFWFLKPPKPTLEKDNIAEEHRPQHPPLPPEPSE